MCPMSLDAFASALRWGRLRRLGELVCTSSTDYGTAKRVRQSFWGETDKNGDRLCKRTGRRPGKVTALRANQGSCFQRVSLQISSLFGEAVSACLYADQLTFR